jgi:hypothetical protein
LNLLGITVGRGEYQFERAEKLALSNHRRTKRMRSGCGGGVAARKSAGRKAVRAF